jgi:hypothetical protein
METSLPSLCIRVNELKDAGFTKKERIYQEDEVVRFFSKNDINPASDLYEMYKSIVCCKDYNFFHLKGRFVPLEIDERAPIERGAKVVGEMGSINLVLVPIFDMLAYCRVFYAGSVNGVETQVYIEAPVSGVSYFVQKYPSLDAFLSDLINREGDVFC